MFKKIARFRFNAWIVLFLVLLTTVIVNVGVNKVAQDRQATANLVGSLPVSSNKVMDGSPTVAPKRMEVVTLRSDNGPEQEAYGATRFAKSRDEITGKETLNLILMVKNGEKVTGDAGAALIKFPRDSGPVLTIAFDLPLKEDFRGDTKLEARFTLSDGTAAVREYRAVSVGKGMATLTSDESVDDAANLMSRSVYVTFRARAAIDKDVYVRLEVDPVDWLRSIKRERLVTLEESIQIETEKTHSFLPSGTAKAKSPKDAT